MASVSAVARTVGTNDIVTPGNHSTHTIVGRGSRRKTALARPRERANRTTMPVLALMEAAPLLPARGALIGLDLGTKTIGVAASDPERRLATPVETIARKKFGTDAHRILQLAAERSAAGFVLGLPINMDGSEGPRAQSTRAFARSLAALTDLPIALWDERLSTAAVERALIAADASRAKRKAVIDQHAAAYILQGALDRLAAKT
jgi:putative holliday junction resolvase